MTKSNIIEDVAEQAELTTAAISEAEGLAKRATALFKAEAGTTKQRAMLFLALFGYVTKYGLGNVERYAEDQGYTTNSKALRCHLAAQFLLGINIFKGTDAQSKADRQTLVRPFAQVLDALLKRSEEHGFLGEEAWFDWYKAVGQQAGLIKWLSAQKPDAATVAKHQPTPESIVDGAFDSASAVTLAETIHLPSLVPGKAILLLARQDQNGTMFVPLPNAGPSTLASVAGYRASGLDTAPPPIVFWHELITIGSAIVPDSTSDEPVIPLAPDDEMNASTDLLPSNAVYLFTGGRFSIASARAYDTRVVELLPRENVDLGLSACTERFMDKKTRNSMQERLAQPSICEGYSGDGGISVVSDQGRVRVKFTHVDRKLNGQLAFPPLTDFRTNWTSRVSADFSPEATAAMNGEAVASFEREFVAMLAGKRKDDRPVTISVTTNSVGFRRDKAKTASYPASADGAADVRVMQSELLAALPTLLSLQREGDLVWKLDPAGLMMVEVTTRVASVRVYLQTLEKGRDTASRKLLERVKALPQSLSVLVGPALALAAA